MEISGTFPSKLEKFKHRSALPNIMIFSFSDLLKNDRTDIISCKMFGHQYISNGIAQLKRNTVSLEHLQQHLSSIHKDSHKLGNTDVLYHVQKKNYVRFTEEYWKDKFK